MDAQEFLTRVLGSGSHYCLFGSRGDGRKIQRFYSSVEELNSSALALDSKNADAYFGVARFATDESRRADNVESLSAFFLDLDCAPGKEFDGKPDAIRQLRDFCDELELPKPVVVDSGGGLHVYWLLSEPAPRDQWVKVAELLKKTCAKQNFPADPAVTADPARILRVPGTHNYKYDTPTEVRFLMQSYTLTSIEEFGGKLLAAHDKSTDTNGGSLFATPVRPVGESSDAALQYLMGARTSSFRTIVERTVRGTGCQQLGHIIQHRAEASEPMWRAALSIAAHCEDKDRAITAVSKGHPDYNPDEAAHKAGLIKGPYLCGSFEEILPGGCEGCPNFGKVKSPIVLGQRVEEAEDNEPVAPPEKVQQPTPQPGPGPRTIPPYPKPYFRAKGGGVYRRGKNEDGEVEDTLIYKYDLYVSQRIRDVELGECLVFHVHFPMDGESQFTLPLTAISSKDDIRKSFAKQGVAAPSWEALMRYVMAWLDELQLTSAADEARRQFGWTDEKCSSFAIGDKELFADYAVNNPPSSTTASMFPYFEPKGTLEGWKKNMEFYNKPGLELHQFIQLVSFGAVLMHDSTVHCVTLHIWSTDSGFGKTTALRSAMAAWGNPEELVMAEGTLNARMHKAEMLNNLPIVVDEITNWTGEQLSDLAYQLSGGKQKDRLMSGSNQTRHRGKGWKTLAMTSSNNPFIERISSYKALPKAEAQRVLEVETTKFFDGETDKALTDEFASDVIKHYGHAGPMFLQYYMRNRETIDKLLLKTRQRIDGAAKLNSQNRFWSELVSKAITAGLVLKSMGLIQWDIKRLSAFVVEMLNANKGSSKELDSTPMDTIINYHNQYWGDFLRISSGVDLRKAHGNGLDNLVVPDFTPNRSIRGRYETDTHKMFLPPEPLRDWCNRHQISFTSLRADLRKEHGAKTQKVRLTKGTTTKLPPQDVIVVEIPDELVDMIHVDEDHDRPSADA